MSLTSPHRLALSRIGAFLGVVLASCAASVVHGEPTPVSFENDVMAVLSRAGCNAGACHGNKSGKGGFKLSLRGQDPADDHYALTRELAGRRVDTFDPDGSLILLKATARLPHEGKVRFSRGSKEYAILRAWVAGGAGRDPADVRRLVKLTVSPEEAWVIGDAEPVRITAIAHYSDGSTRDVTDLACFEQSNILATISPAGAVKREKLGETTVVVRYLHLQQPVRVTFVEDRPGFAWKGPEPANYVDRHLFAKLKSLQLNPSAPCTDAEFLRRAYLDLHGSIPTVDEARAFLNDSGPDKRAKLIDRLMDRPEFADFWALKWADVLRLEERGLDKKGAQGFHHWIRQSVATNKPLDRFVRELVSARGSTYANPPANYYRASRDAVTRAESAAQVFLGVRLNCAQCHNHPFDRWTQEDYYSWAAVFGRVSYKVLENRRRDNNDSHEFVGEQVVFLADASNVTDPRTNKPARARLLGERNPGGDASLDALADWMTAPSNPFFARAQVNRIWYHLMGRGIVDPVDDFRATNPPSHPGLLDELAKDFIASGHDMRHLIRTIMLSRTYQLSSDADATNGDDTANYARTLPRRLTAEQIVDAKHQALGVPAEFRGYPVGTRAVQMPAVTTARGRKTTAETLLAVFGKPPRLLACDCERSPDATMPQAFQMISGPEITKILASPDNRLAKLIESGKPVEAIVEDLYLAILSRPPAAAESSAMTKHVTDSKDPRRGLEDVAWALLNAKEFILRK